MKESIILKIYNGEDPIGERTEPAGDEFERLFRQKEDDEKKIKALISEEGKEMFETYVRNSGHKSIMIEEEAFRQGVITGVKLMMEIMEG